MKFHNQIKTKLGDVWVADASVNGFVRNDTESRQEFETRFLKEMLGAIIENGELEHEENGAPLLKGHPDLNLSISHSEKWFTVYISSLASVGVDIEVQFDQIENTKTYFLSDHEMESIQPTKGQLKVSWGVKEAMYKMLRGKIKGIKEDIQITFIDDKSAKSVFRDQQFDLRYMQSDCYTLVFTNALIASVI